MLNYYHHVLSVNLCTAVRDPVLNHIHGWIKLLLSERERTREKRRNHCDSSGWGNAAGRDLSEQSSQHFKNDTQGGLLFDTLQRGCNKKAKLSEIKKWNKFQRQSKKDYIRNYAACSTNTYKAMDKYMYYHKSHLACRCLCVIPLWAHCL